MLSLVTSHQNSYLDKDCPALPDDESADFVESCVGRLTDVYPVGCCQKKQRQLMLN